MLHVALFLALRKREQVIFSLDLVSLLFDCLCCLVCIHRVGMELTCNLRCHNYSFVVVFFFLGGGGGIGLNNRRTSTQFENQASDVCKAQYYL